MKGYTTAASLAIGASLLANSVFAQAQAQPRTTTTTTQGEQRQIQLDERTLASCVAIANQKEVAITQFAKEKLKDEDVKEFAEMIIKDHQAFLEKLQKFTPEAGRNNSFASDNSSGVKQAGGPATGTNRVQQTSGQQGQRTQGQGVDAVQLHREVAQECLASAKKKLTEDDAKIDKCFLGMQAAAHMGMLDHLKVLQRHTSGELNKLLADASETTQKHLDKAEALMKGLKDEKSKDEKSSKKND
jgi:hypothetical protein